MMNITLQGAFTDDEVLMEYEKMGKKQQARTGWRMSTALASAARAALALLYNIRPAKVAIFIGSLFLFILAILLMKEGAHTLTPLMRDNFHVDNAINSLGFGWLFAYVIMSGSPVAAAALTFFDAGALSSLGAFTMITGSRLGASFIVLFIGFIYVLRGHDRAAGLSMGLISLTVTFTTYVFGLFVGLGLFQSGLLDHVYLDSGTQINSIVELLFDPIIGLFVQHLPDWLLFLAGMGVIMISFNLFDRALPEMSLKESQLGRVGHMVYRPWVMFILGGLVTTISMSVSVSLSILVPLSNRGYIRRENVIPYIMGANITTFIDTLLATLLLDNPTAFTIVLVEMLSVAIVSVIILAASYRHYERSILAFVSWVTARNRNLAFFMVVILIVPLFLMFL